MVKLLRQNTLRREWGCQQHALEGKWFHCHHFFASQLSWGGSLPVLPLWYTALCQSPNQCATTSGTRSWVHLYLPLILSGLVDDYGNSKLTNTYTGYKRFVMCLGGIVCICSTHITVQDYASPIPLCLTDLKRGFYAEWEDHHLG